MHANDAGLCMHACTHAKRCQRLTCPHDPVPRCLCPVVGTGLFDAEDSVDEEDHWMLRQLADKTGGKITEAVVDPSKVPCPPPPPHT